MVKDFLVEIWEKKVFEWGQWYKGRKSPITDQNHHGLFSFLFLENHSKCFKTAQLVMGFWADPSSLSDMSSLLKWLIMFASPMFEHCIHLVLVFWGYLLFFSALSLCREHRWRESENSQQDILAGITALIVFSTTHPLLLWFLQLLERNERITWSYMII